MDLSFIGGVGWFLLVYLAVIAADATIAFGVGWRIRHEKKKAMKKFAEFERKMFPNGVPSEPVVTTVGDLRETLERMAKGQDDITEDAGSVTPDA